MKRDKMYPERVGNISAFRGCGFGCTYCAFRRALRRSKCEKCRTFEPHAHLEVLNNRPPKTKEGEFLTIGLTGDISFADVQKGDMLAILDYVCKWSDRTFLLQSKNPAFFSTFVIPKNVIIGTTIETTSVAWDSQEQWVRHDRKVLIYSDISKAPHPYKRHWAMQELRCRKEVTIEPIMDFNEDVMVQWIQDIEPEFVYIGYNSKDNVRIPEPSLKKTERLIERLKVFTIVRTKLLRKAWWEG